MTRPFAERLFDAQKAAQSDIGLFLSPKLTAMPLPMQRYDDPFLPFGKAIIDATHDLVCLVMFDFAAYLTIGAAGIVALERTIAYANASGLLTVLHVPLATPGYVQAVGETALNVDAVTVSDSLYAPVYEKALNGGVFIVNPYNYINNDGLTKLMPDGTSLYVKLIGDTILHSEHGDDFAQAVRRTVDTMRHDDWK